MTPKIKGQNYCLLVTNIQHAYKTRNGNYIHLITFVENDGTIYQAEEYEPNPVSRFIKNLRNNFVVSQPGKAGYLDWVRFSSVEQGSLPKSVYAHKDDIFIAQTAFNNATLLGLQRGWDMEQILNEAYILAGNIKKMAVTLGQVEEL